MVRLDLYHDTLELDFMSINIDRLDKNLGDSMFGIAWFFLDRTVDCDVLVSGKEQYKI